MIVDDKRYGQFGQFSAFGGSWEDWCDAAAASWTRVTGNAEEAQTLNKKCHAWSLFAPWEDAGRVPRGLPGNWSTDDNKTRLTSAGAYAQSAGNFFKPAVEPVIETTKKTMEAAIGISPTTTSDPMATQKFVPAVQLPTKNSLVGIAKIVNQPPAAPASTFIPAAKWPLVVGGLAVAGLGAFLLLGRKGAKPAMGGFSGYKRSKRRSKR